MTEIALRETTYALTLTEKIEYAKALSIASMLPRQYQQNPGNLLFAIEYADALGIKPIHAITSIHVIEGRPSASADLIAATVRRAGHKLRITGDDVHAVAQLVRADDPEFTYEARWDIDKARMAGLASKSVWKSYPAAMLRSRAITEVARMGATDALFGVIYTPEELGAEVDAQGTPIITSAPESAAPRSSVSRLRAAVPSSTESAVGPQSGAESGEVSGFESPPAQDAPGEPAITPAQLKKLHTVLSKVGYTDREQGLDYYARVIGRRVESSKELSKAEAGRIIDSLENPPEGVNPESGEVTEAELIEDGWNEPTQEELDAMAAEQS